MKSLFKALVPVVFITMSVLTYGCSDNNNEPDSPTIPGNTSSNICTIEASPLAFSAVLKGRINGTMTPDEVGFELSYIPDFDESKIARISIEGTTGEFEIEKRGLIDQIKVYYRAYAIYEDRVLYGEVKTFITNEGCYELDGIKYKFIKVKGSYPSSFSMMQTELLPDAELKIDGRKIGIPDANGDGYVSKGEMREILSTIGIGFMRAPTLAEWKFAASGGIYSKGYAYSGSDDINSVGWYKNNSNGARKRPALKKANELGFYDMSGNCAEFVADYTDDELLKSVEYVMTMPNSIKDVPAKFFDTTWSSPKACGGSWKNIADDCKITSSVKDSWKSNQNKYPSEYTFRFVYSRPD